MSVPAQLADHAFTPESASKAGRASAAKRRARRDLERTDARHAAATLAAYAEASHAIDIPAATIGAAAYVLARIVDGQVPIRHGQDAAALVTALIDVARLLSGQPTSTAAIVHMSADEARKRLFELTEHASALSNVRASSSAEAAADTSTPVRERTFD